MNKFILAAVVLIVSLFPMCVGATSEEEVLKLELDKSEYEGPQAIYKMNYRNSLCFEQQKTRQFKVVAKNTGLRKFEFEIKAYDGNEKDKEIIVAKGELKPNKTKVLSFILDSKKLGFDTYKIKASLDFCNGHDREGSLTLYKIKEPKNNLCVDDNYPV